MKELLTVVEAEIKEVAKPLLVTSLNSTQEYSRHEMAMHLGITEDQLMQILRGEILAITDEQYTLYLTYVSHTGAAYEVAFGTIIKFNGNTNTNTFYIERS